MGMELIRSKTAVFKPGKVALPVGAERPERPVLSGGAGGYDPATACWMMILSWAIYHPYGGAGGRAQLLDEEDWEEFAFLSVEGIDCAMVRAADSGADSWTVVVFQGTTEIRQWGFNVDVLPRKWSGEGLVHSGFSKALDLVWDHLEPRLERAGGPVLFCGHSLGGALATLAAARWAGGRPAGEAAGTAYTFGAPRVGNARFSAACGRLNLWRVVLGDDLVPQLPFSLSALPEKLHYRHAGEEVLLWSEERTPKAPILSGKELEAALKEGLPPQALVHHAPVNYFRALAEGVEG